MAERSDSRLPLLIRSSGQPQMRYGFIARSNWGEGEDTAAHTVGDVIYVPEDAPCATSGRCSPGLHRIESCFSIDEGPMFYYRLSPAAIVGEKGKLRVVTDWDSCSDRLHVMPREDVDYTEGWIKLYSAREALGA